MKPESQPFDPSRFEDALACRTKWSLMRNLFPQSGKCRLRCCDLGGEAYGFTVPMWYRVLDLIGFLMALWLLVIGLSLNSKLLEILMSASVALLLLLMLCRIRGYRKEGWFYSSGCVFYIARVPVRGVAGDLIRDEETLFDEIGALQILEHRFWFLRRYELNLVRKNGSRVNLATHGNYVQLESDAIRLARYLNVSVWDATAYHGGKGRK